MSQVIKKFFTFISSTSLANTEMTTVTELVLILLFGLFHNEIVTGERIPSTFKLMTWFSLY